MKISGTKKYLHKMSRYMLVALIMPLCSVAANAQSTGGNSKEIILAGDSDSSINTALFSNRRFGDRMSLNLGYRYFTDDFDNLPSYAWDMTQSGPVVGYTWVF